MPVDKIIFYQKEKVNFKNLKIVKTITKKLERKLILLLIEVPQQEIEKVELFLEGEGIQFEIKDRIEAGLLKEEIRKEKPDLFVLTQEKISPLEHIFRITSSEKMVKELENVNVLLLWEDAEEINKVLINVDKETATPFYIKSTFLFVKKLGVKFDFITSFYESFYEFRLRKTHPDEEAKQILLQLFEEHVETVKRKIAESLKGEKAELVVIKGDPKKEIPYFARRKGYDLLIINEHIEDRDSYIENSQNSVGIFKDQQEEEGE